MANFAKTTEIDISSLHDAMEEETPKKNKKVVIIPIIFSILIAFGIWLFATENSTDIHTRTFEVNVGNEIVEVDVKGTYSQLADMKKEYIIVTKDGNAYSVPQLSSEAGDNLKTVTLTIAD